MRTAQPSEYDDNHMKFSIFLIAEKMKRSRCESSKARKRAL